MDDFLNDKKAILPKRYSYRHPFPWRKTCNTFIPLAEYKSSFMCDLVRKEKLELGFFPGFLSGFKSGNVV